jgi:hypothetical protein
MFLDSRACKTVMGVTRTSQYLMCLTLQSAAVLNRIMSYHFVFPVFSASPSLVWLLRETLLRSFATVLFENLLCLGRKIIEKCIKPDLFARPVFPMKMGICIHSIVIINNQIHYFSRVCFQKVSIGLQHSRT